MNELAAAYYTWPMLYHHTMCAERRITPHELICMGNELIQMISQAVKLQAMMAATEAAGHTPTAKHGERYMGRGLIQITGRAPIPAPLNVQASRSVVHSCIGTATPATTNRNHKPGKRYSPALPHAGN